MAKQSSFCAEAFGLALLDTLFVSGESVRLVKIFPERCRSKRVTETAVPLYHFRRKALSRRWLNVSPG